MQEKGSSDSPGRHAGAYFSELNLAEEEFKSQAKHVDVASNSVQNRVLESMVFE